MWITTLFEQRGNIFFCGTIWKYLTDTTFSTLKYLGVDCNNLIGQGYASASSMKDSFNDVLAVVRKSHP